MEQLKLIDGRDFQRAAAQRLSTAEFLLKHRYHLDAIYLSGYAVECALKALILHRTLEIDRPQMLRQISQGSAMHRPEVLGDVLRGLKVRLPLELVMRYRRFPWRTSIRYEHGRRRRGEAFGFWKTAKQTYDWVDGSFR